MRYINYDVIRNNIINILKTNEIMWVLKDNAYGFGIEKMISIGIELGIKDYAVKDINEGIIIRNINDEVNVLVLGRTKEINRLKEYNLIGTINDYDEYVKYKENNVRAHLAIDVGMNRFGMKRGFIGIINDSIIEAIYTHIYRSEDMLEKIIFIEDLAKRYNKKLHIGGSICYKHSSSMLRIGKILYENSISLIGNIVNVKYVKCNEGVGYDSYYVADKDVIIGVCDVGYVNGLNRFYNSLVFINDKFYKVVGKVCMDQCFILIDEHVKIGDKVEFFGEKITEDEFILKNNISKYELFLQIL